ncbi:MAG TPA: hypothetical protein EYG93_00830 [Sulfurospirillum arcachonense]|nr:hypothetical protein [Sulfurospirillum arcachonense]
MNKKIYSGNKIKKAGKKLINTQNDEESLEILSYWRALHSEPLDKAFKYVEKYGIEIDKNILLAKRLKRTESIVNKLGRLKGEIQLSTMNDIAGCRAILPTQKKVNKLINELNKKKVFEIFRDYIAEPRESGYRSIHMIGNFEEKSNKKNMKVELQIRTHTQHSWATAVEIVDLFTKDSIKTNEGSREWSNFFIHVSKLFVLFDDNPYINSLKKDNKKNENSNNLIYSKIYRYLVEQLRQNPKLIKDVKIVSKLTSKLEVLKKFNLFTSSIKFTHEQKDIVFKDGYILIIIDNIDNKVFNIETNFFDKNSFEQATEKYLQVEKDILLNKHFVTALVSSNSINEIEKAYPNYFADSTSFIKYTSLVQALDTHFNKGILNKWF